MKNLRALRESHKMSQKKLADRIGLHQSQIHGYESGAYEPDTETLIAFANLFETSVDYILGHTSISHKIEPVEKYDLNQDEAALIDEYRLLSPNVRKSIRTVVSAFVAENAASIQQQAAQRQTANKRK